MWVVVSTTDSCSHVSFDVYRGEREREREAGCKTQLLRTDPLYRKKIEGTQARPTVDGVFFFFLNKCKCTMRCGWKRETIRLPT